LRALPEVEDTAANFEDRRKGLSCSIQPHEIVLCERRVGTEKDVVLLEYQVDCAKALRTADYSSHSPKEVVCSPQKGFLIQVPGRNPKRIAELVVMAAMNVADVAECIDSTPICAQIVAYPDVYRPSTRIAKVLAVYEMLRIPSHPERRVHWKRRRVGYAERSQAQTKKASLADEADQVISQFDSLNDILPEQAFGQSARGLNSFDRSKAE
jgi:hypothetical protein